MRAGLVEPAFLVTTCPRPDSAVRAKAEGIAAQYELPLERRAERTLADLRRSRGVEGVLAVGREGLRYVTPEVTLTFHPSMTRMRLHNLESGRGDPMLTAMRLQPGDRVLDCTLGLGVDAVVAASMVGSKGAVDGLEVVLPIFLVVADGLATYEAPNQRLTEAMRRVRAHWAEASAFLASVTPGDYEVIYIDPFFEKPVAGSSSIAPVRALGAHDWVPLRRAAEKATEIARRCVVVKGNRGSAFFRDLPVAEVVAGRHSSIEYAVLSAR